MSRTFNAGFFRKFIRAVFYFLWLCPVLLTLFCTVTSLKVLSMTDFHAATKVLYTKIFHSIP